MEGYQERVEYIHLSPMRAGLEKHRFLSPRVERSSCTSSLPLIVWLSLMQWILAADSHVVLIRLVVIVLSPEPYAQGSVQQARFGPPLTPYANRCANSFDLKYALSRVFFSEVTFAVTQWAAKPLRQRLDSFR